MTKISLCMFVHATQPVEIFGNFSTPFGTVQLAIHWHPRKILRRSSQLGNPFVGELNARRIAKYSDFGPIECYLFMAALCRLVAHTIIFCPVISIVLSSSCFPRLILAVGDWMSTMLTHMVWPQCEFRMQVWNLPHAARWKLIKRTQKWRKKSPSGHHRTTLSDYIFATRARIDNRKNLLSSNISPTCNHNMRWTSACTSGWDRLASLGHPGKFQQLLRLGSVTARQSSSGVSQTLQRGTRNGITELSQRSRPMFGWAAITLGIGRHSSSSFFSYAVNSRQDCWPSIMLPM